MKGRVEVCVKGSVGNCVSMITGMQRMPLLCVDTCCNQLLVRDDTHMEICACFSVAMHTYTKYACTLTYTRHTLTAIIWFCFSCCSNFKRHCLVRAMVLYSITTCVAMAVSLH